MIRRNFAGLSLVEFLVAVVVIIGVCLVVPFFFSTHSPVSQPHQQMAQTLSNMRQLHLATQQMALDRVTSGNTNIGWPGDIGGTFSNWTRQLVDGGYLSANDLSKLLSGPGVVVPPGEIPVTNNTAILVYAAAEKSPGEVIFLTSANFTYTPTGGTLNPAIKPYGDEGFVIFSKGGSGEVLRGLKSPAKKDIPEMVVVRNFIDLPNGGASKEDHAGKKEVIAFTQKDGEGVLQARDVYPDAAKRYVPLCR